MLNTLHFTDIR